MAISGVAAGVARRVLYNQFKRTLVSSVPSHKYGDAPRASKRRSGKARDRVVLLEYVEGAERSRSG
ncbi:MAG: hypothetical protein KKB90_05850 [Actinobacteria bacterium]|nr:hypothetical protein [Actinomycetota bacterium]MCG2818024.1 hypothetical protein [Actinomycetes bacterium]MBU4358230.1 hypothetical protein [Actinomycetota bacterium]MBU4391371.1 hypothetical protein [Actinomycetota bacterium]MBU4401185.1 hypothetical protein [Actinomycetota bacterium]